MPACTSTVCLLPSLRRPTNVLPVLPVLPFLPSRGERFGTPAAPGTSRYVPAGSAGAGGGGAHRFREGRSPGRVAAASSRQAARVRHQGEGVAGTPRKRRREARPRLGPGFPAPGSRQPARRPGGGSTPRPAQPGPGARDGTCCVLKSQPRQHGRAACSAMAADGPAARPSVLPGAAVSPRSSAQRRRARPSLRPAGLPDPCHSRACALAPPAGGRDGDTRPAGPWRASHLCNTGISSPALPLIHLCLCSPAHLLP